MVVGGRWTVDDSGNWWKKIRKGSEDTDPVGRDGTADIPLEQNYERVVDTYSSAAVRVITNTVTGLPHRGLARAAGPFDELIRSGGGSKGLRRYERRLIVDFIKGVFGALLDRLVLSVPDAAVRVRLVRGKHEDSGDRQTSIAAERKSAHVGPDAGA